MKILYVSQYYPPEMGAPAARVSELSRRWSKEGHQVTVLTGFPNNPTGVVPTEYRGKMRRLVFRERVDGVNVVRTWLVPLPNRKPLERIVNFVSFCLSSSLTGIFLQRPDVIIATSPQLLVGLTGWWLRLMKRVPFVLEIRDFWPESITASGVGHEKSLMVRLLRALSGFLYRTCDHLVVVTPAFKKELIGKWDVPSEKISVVQHGVEIDMFTPDGPDALASIMPGNEAKFVVSDIGTHGQAHGLGTVLQAAAQVRDSLPDVLFLLVGEGAEKERLVSMAQQMGLENVRFLPQQSRESIPALIRASDVCLVTLKKADVFKTVVPSKMLEFMACGRPIVLAVDGQARQLLEAADGGLFVEPENALELRPFTRRIIEVPSELVLRHLFALMQFDDFYYARAFPLSGKSAVHRRVVDEIKGSVGRYHLPPIPDWSACVMVLSMVATVTVMDEFLLVQSTVKENSGLQWYEGREQTASASFSDNLGTLLKVPLKLVTVHNLVADSILQGQAAVRDHLPSFALSWSRYFRYVYRDLEAMNGSANGDGQYIDAFFAALEKQPASVRQQVARLIPDPHRELKLFWTPRALRPLIRKVAKLIRAPEILAFARRSAGQRPTYVLGDEVGFQNIIECNDRLDSFMPDTHPPDEIEAIFDRVYGTCRTWSYREVGLSSGIRV